MADLAGIDGERARALLETENVRFTAERPRSTALLERARESMPRGVPMSWMDDLYEHPSVWVSHGEVASLIAPPSSLASSQVWWWARYRPAARCEAT